MWNFNDGCETVTTPSATPDGKMKYLQSHCSLYLTSSPIIILHLFIRPFALFSQMKELNITLMFFSLFTILLIYINEQKL